MNLNKIARDLERDGFSDEEIESITDRLADALIQSDRDESMKHTESDYVTAGYNFERARNPAIAQGVASQIRSMMEKEEIDERSEARRLIEQGRQEARK